MERTFRNGGQRLVLLFILATSLAAAPGCVSAFIATMLYQGRMAPAGCEALEGQRVALVCTAESGDFGPNPNVAILARRIEKKLKANVEDIQLVDQQQIEAWLDENDSPYMDYLEIGKGVKADMVVAIEISGIRLQDNPTMYKGKADFQMKVFDVNDDGREIYAPFTPPVIYPRISGLHTASVSKEVFRQKFLDVLAEDIAQHFYEHDLNKQIAIDTPDLPAYR